MNSSRRHRRVAWAVAFAVVLVDVGAATGECDEGDAVDRLAMARLQFPPLGLPAVPIPKDNPVTVEKIALGRKLFFDRRLSKNGTMSCGMCHIPEQGFTNNELETPVGINGRSVRRNAPTVLNTAYLRQLFHDGRAGSLESQAVLPLFAPDEMGNASEAEFIGKLSELADYPELFEKAFGGGPSIQRVVQAIASWERTLLAADSPFDRWQLAGQQQALNATQKRGFELFVGKAHCVECHSYSSTNTLFTDRLFHDTGIGYLRRQRGQPTDRPVTIEIAPGVFVSAQRKIIAQVEGPRPEDLGRFELTDQPEDKWHYRTPTLRNVAVTAPYMHDGSLPTLEAVVRYYNRGAAPHAGLDRLIKPLHLDDNEVASLVAFLQSLTAGNLVALETDARSAAVSN